MPDCASRTAAAFRKSGSVHWHARLLRAWHLAVLRFAVTLDNADRLNVLALANQIDGLGGPGEDRPDFSFFRKTSSELITAILQPGRTADAILRKYVAGIDDVRLRRALAAFLGIEDRKPVAAIEYRQPVAAKRRSKPGIDLWAGLPSRVRQ